MSEIGGFDSTASPIPNFDKFKFSEINLLMKSCVSYNFDTNPPNMSRCGFNPITIQSSFAFISFSIAVIVTVFPDPLIPVSIKHWFCITSLSNSSTISSVIRLRAIY